MSDATSGDAQKQAQNLSLRNALAAAYSAVQGQQNVQSFSSFTFEDAAQLQLDQIQGTPASTGTVTPSRPNQLAQVQAILQNVTNAVAQIQALPENAFGESDTSTNVNTAA